MAAPFVEEVKQLLLEELDLEGRTAASLDEQAPLFGSGLGLDSLDALQIAMAVEERFAVRIPEGEEAHSIFQSIASLAAYVQSAKAADR